MAISSYDVNKEEIRVFLILSFMMVGGLIFCGFLFSFLLRLLRGKSTGGLLEKVAREKKTPNTRDD
jgi:hypothetical protein